MAIFDQALLWDADLSWSNLMRSSFVGTDLSDTNLRGANLSYADFRNANLNGTDFRSANLKGADFRDVENLDCANLDDANRSQIRWN
jgi:uncharacterized protein YjbI with pentapeptide repeats